jgi:hypothetical protein
MIYIIKKNRKRKIEKECQKEERIIEGIIERRIIIFRFEKNGKRVETKKRKNKK